MFWHNLKYDIVGLNREHLGVKKCSVFLYNCFLIKYLWNKTNLNLKLISALHLQWEIISCWSKNWKNARLGCRV